MHEVHKPELKLGYTGYTKNTLLIFFRNSIYTLLVTWKVVAVKKYNAKLMKQTFLWLISQVKVRTISYYPNSVEYRIWSQIDLL